MENRDFVLKPMVELNANFRHPILNKTMKQLLDALARKTLDTKPVTSIAAYFNKEFEVPGIIMELEKKRHFALDRSSGYGSQACP